MSLLLKDWFKHFDEKVDSINSQHKSLELLRKMVHKGIKRATR